MRRSGRKGAGGEAKGEVSRTRPWRSRLGAPRQGVDGRAASAQGIRAYEAFVAPGMEPAAGPLFPPFDQPSQTHTRCALGTSLSFQPANTKVTRGVSGTKVLRRGDRCSKQVIALLVSFHTEDHAATPGSKLSQGQPRLDKKKKNQSDPLASTAEGSHVNERPKG